jgi:immune inhibitor A
MKHLWRLLGAMAVLAVMVVPSALSAGDPGAASADAATTGTDSFESPMGQKRNALRQTALQQQVAGVIPANAKVAKVAKGQYVELGREGEDQIWTVLSEFGTAPATHSHGTLGVIGHGGAAGPLHNAIPEPDRAQNNTTIWTRDFSRQHYLDLLFTEGKGVNSMRQFYIEQSSNRYAVNGDVTDWVQLPFNTAAYGSNYCGSIVCTRDIQRYLEDTFTAWYAGQVAAGKSAAQIDSYLSRFDVWDRYDYDHDGNFNEADGYIDHFQGLHAGEGEETGGGSYGEDAIWSHRSYTNVAGVGSVGPSFNKFGGLRIGGSSYWVGDYTIEPENGGVGVFAHEYGHDAFGLPDLYDTSGNTGGAENSTGFWTLMSSGSYGNDGTVDIGSKPIGFGAWEKFQMGWLNYEVAFAGKKSEHKVGPSVYNTKQAQGVFVVLPPTSNGATSTFGTPTEGSNAWYSTAGDGLDVSMTRDVTLPAGSVSLSMKAWYEIETCWDYAYIRVSTDGGTTYSNLATNVSDAGNENGQNFGNGITGISGAPKACDNASGSPAWVPVTADLTPYAGQTVKLQIRYWTDGAAQGRGFEFDELAITAGASTVFADGAESGDNGWTLKGFRRTTGTETVYSNHYYLAENRQYTGYDDGLRTGPYNFGFLNTLPDWAERFPYQDGLLISYWDTGQGDNNVGDHPGEGLILPIDARPAIMHWADGTTMRPRLQSFDSTFGLQATDAITLHKDGVAASFPSQPGVSVFNDLQSWWTASDPGDAPANGRYQAKWSSVDVPKTGTQIRVKSETPGGFTQIEVSPSK